MLLDWGKKIFTSYKEKADYAAEQSLNIWI